MDVGTDTTSGIILVSGPERSLIHAPVDFKSDANVHIQPGGYLDLTAPVKFDTLYFSPQSGFQRATFSGEGSLAFSNEVLVNKELTLNFIGGHVDFDGNDDTGDVISIAAPLVVNAESLDAFGKANTSGTNTISIDATTTSGSLQVNLDDPAASWTINSEGVINLRSASAVTNILSGSPLDLHGTMNVSGQARLTTRLNVGPTGRLNLNGDAYLQAAGIESELGGSVHVTPSAANFVLGTDGATGGFRFGSTSVTTLDGDLALDNPRTTIDAGAAFQGPGRLMNMHGRELTTEDGAQIGVLIENIGTLSIADEGIGQIRSLGFEQAASGHFTIDVHGIGSAMFDQLLVDNTATLAGLLIVDLGNSYANPMLGDAFTVIAAASVNGIFSDLIQPNEMPIGKFLNVRYRANTVELVVVDTLPGDYNRNNIVDAADYTVWRNSTGQMVLSFAGADGNGDTIVDFRDYLFWKSQYGKSAAMGSGTAVPEPASALVWLCAMAVILAMRGKRWPSVQRITAQNF